MKVWARVRDGAALVMLERAIQFRRAQLPTAAGSAFHVCINVRHVSLSLLRNPNENASDLVKLRYELVKLRYEKMLRAF